MEKFKMENYNTKLFQFPTTTKEKVMGNLEAIRLIKRLEADGLEATEEDKIILSKYVGWGGLANDVFDKKISRFAKEREEIENLVTKEEYKAMELSSLTAYYTSPEVAAQMWAYLEKNGFKGGNILDPSMGTGVFFHTMPEEIRQNSKFYGVELDTLTGAIAKQLFPEATIYIKGFEDVNFVCSNFDLVISNIPFADIRIVDKRYSNKPYLIHDYFIKKSLDIVREEGVVSVITSIGSSDKRSGSIIPEIESKCTFLGGIRLPNNTFKEVAGTSVTTDILYFQKRNQHDMSVQSLYFNKPQKSELDEEGRVYINPYFLQEAGQDNPQVLGNYEVRFYNGATLSLKPYGTDSLKEQLKKAFDNFISPRFDDTSVSLEIVAEEDNQINQELLDRLNIRMHEYEADEDGNIFYRDHNGVRPAAKIVELTRWNDAEGNFSHWDSKASECQIEDFEKRFKENPNILVNTYQSAEPSKRGLNKGFYKVVYFYEVPQEDSLRSRMLGMIALKHAYQNVIDIQLEVDYSEKHFKALLNELNTVYDGFVKKYGFINAPINSRAFSRDDRYPLIASLEDEVLDERDTTKVVFIKTAAFTKPMVRPKRQINVVNNAKDALNICLSEGLGVDFKVMTSVYPNSTKASLLLELGDDILIDVQCYCETSNIRYVVKEAFLSGDVKTTRRLIGELIDRGDRTANWEHYRDLIDMVIPEDIALVDIDYKLGSVWIPNNVIGMFILNTFGEKEVSLDDPESYNIIVDTPIGRGFNETEINYLFNSEANIRLGLRYVEGTNKYSRGTDVVRYLLGSDQPTIKKNIGTSLEPKYVEDTAATASLREVEMKIQELFRNFVNDNEEVATVVKNTYNEKYNRYVTRLYDGSNLVFDGLAKGFELRPHQKDAVQRILEDKRALLAHEVGTGKTLTMVSAGFKMKELGLINKPLFVVPSSLTAQFGQEIMRFFPTKKVFVTTERDFEKSRRRLFISRIITGDYDGVVIGHSQFEKIKVSSEREQLFYEDRLVEIEQIIDYARDKEDKISFKTAQAMKKRLESNLEKLSLCKDKDEFIDFEQLGIDMLFVDEAHSYKNIRPMTKLGSLPGICNVTAQKNIDMQMKIRSIQEAHNGTNVVFATGTPVSNSISEMFTMMSYIQPDILEKHGVNNFDSWVGDFGVIETLFEVNTTGSEFISRKRFSRFTNLPELMALYRRTTDIKMTKDLDLPTPSVRQFAVKLDMTEAQKAFQDSLVARTEKIKSGQVEPSEDNMLKIVRC